MEGAGDGDFQLAIVDEVTVSIIGTSGRCGGVGAGVGLSMVSRTPPGFPINRGNPGPNPPTSSLAPGAVSVSGSSSASSFATLTAVPDSVLSLARAPSPGVANLI